MNGVEMQNRVSAIRARKDTASVEDVEFLLMVIEVQQAEQAMTIKNVEHSLKALNESFGVWSRYLGESVQMASEEYTRVCEENVDLRKMAGLEVKLPPYDPENPCRCSICGGGGMEPETINHKMSCPKWHS